jgi:hypothetical protein
MATKKYEVIESSRDRIVLQLVGKSQKSTTVKYLEIPDVLFNHNSSVPCIDDKDTLIFGIVSARLFANDNPDMELVAYGHTDSSGETEFNKKLSEERAKAIKALLDNDRDTYVSICSNRFKVEDYQTILSALTKLYGWSCDPGAIDNEDGPNTQAAVNNFQTDYATYYGKSINENGVVGPQTWGAIFDVITEQIDLIVKSEIGDTKPVITYGKGGSGVVGCGEEFAQDAFARKGRRSKKDRRVEITFVNPNDPIDETPYTGPTVFEPIEIKADRPPVDKKPEKPKLKDFEICCSHTDKGRRVAKSGRILCIVPGAKIKPFSPGDKITCKTIPENASISVDWLCDGYLNAKSKGTTAEFTINGFGDQYVDAFAGLLQANLYQLLPPRTVTISATDSYKNILKSSIFVYSKTTAAMEVDFQKIKVFKWLNIVQNKLKKAFHFLPANVEPKVFVGKVMFEGGFEEAEGSPDIFYKFALKGGFDPLFGYEAKMEFSLIPVLNAIPKLLRKFVGDIKAVFGSRGGLATVISYVRDKIDAKSGKIEATGSIAVFASLNAEMGNKKVLEAIALLGTSIECNGAVKFFKTDNKEHWGFSDTEIKVEWGGLKGELTWSLFDGTFSSGDKFVLVEPIPLYP